MTPQLAFAPTAFWFRVIFEGIADFHDDVLVSGGHDLRPFFSNGFDLKLGMRKAFLLVTMALVSVCRSADEPDYEPIKTGNEWIRDVAVTGTNNITKICKGRRKVLEAELRDGKMYFKILVRLEGPLVHNTNTQLIRKDSIGLYSLDTETENAKEQIELLFPFKVGLNWSRSIGGVTVTDAVVGVENIKIFGKTYHDCIHIRSTTADGSYTENYWKAQDLGTIKSVIVYADGSSVHSTIREFRPAKK